MHATLALTVVVAQCALIAGSLVHRVARRRAEAALRASQSALRSRDQEVHTLAGRVIAAEEAERARIARELHDDLSQKLAVLSIDLQQLLVQSGGADGLTRQLHAATASVVDIATDVRNLSHRLHPARLEMLGLEPALRNLCRDMSAAHNLRIDFQHELVKEPIRHEAALCLFRVTQEALRNVVKHSVSSVAHVHLSQRQGVFQLRISDSGCGFSHLPAEGGLGLVSMRERVHFAGGEMSVQSMPGQGTRIDVRVPAKRARNEHSGVLRSDAVTASVPRRLQESVSRRVRA